MSAEPRYARYFIRTDPDCLVLIIRQGKHGRGKEVHRCALYPRTREGVHEADADAHDWANRKGYVLR